MMKFLDNIRSPFGKSSGEEIEDKRQRSLDIYMPRLGPKPKDFDTNVKKLHTLLTSFGHEKTRAIIEANAYLEHLNKTEVKLSRRAELNSVILTSLAPYISSMYRKYSSKGTSFPEATERKTDLTETINLIKNLIMSHKIVLANDYSLPIKKFNQNLKRVGAVSIRILELTLWSQRFQALRFQVLSSQDWHDLNVIYFIFAQFFDANQACELTDEMSLYKASGMHTQGNNTRTVNSIYISIQIFGLLDVTSWPSNSIHTLEQYLSQHEDLIKITVDEKGESIKDCVITYPDHNARPMFDCGEVNTTCCYFNLLELKLRVIEDKNDYIQKQFIGENSDEKKRLIPHGKIEALEYNPTLLDLMEKNLSKALRGAERKTFYGSKLVSIYNGLAASYRLLYNHQNKNQESGDSQAFYEAAAKHSSLLVDDDSNAMECQWRIINESENGVLVRTVETKYMHAMEVGQLVSIIQEEDDVQEFPQLGFITRLDRLSGGEIDVAIVKISTLAEAVTIMEPGHEKNAQDMTPGMLLKNLEEVWQLILPRHVHFVSGSPAIIKRPDANIPVRLGDAVITKTGFIMFEVRSPGLR